MNFLLSKFWAKILSKRTEAAVSNIEFTVDNAQASRQARFIGSGLETLLEA